MLLIIGRFRQFDYGVRKNKIKYGTGIPPEYNLRNVTSKVALFYAFSDWFTQRQVSYTYNITKTNRSNNFFLIYKMKFDLIFILIVLN